MDSDVKMKRDTTGYLRIGTEDDLVEHKKDDRKGNGMLSKVTRAKDELWKMGTWNVRSLSGKEDDLVEEFEKAKLDVLGISETKRKGKGEMSLRGNHVLIYSGVDPKSRAREGVGCVVHFRHQNRIRKWTAITERILTVELEIEETETTIVVAYGPSEDEVAKKKG